ncbi:MAG: hypothetical protein WD070_07910 [Pirellulaceae bacterium]
MKEFLSDPEFQQELSQEAEAVREQVRTLRPATVVTAGGSYLFTETLNLPVQWVAILPHKDNGALTNRSEMPREWFGLIRSASRTGHTDQQSIHVKPKDVN